MPITAFSQPLLIDPHTTTGGDLISKGSKNQAGRVEMGWEKEVLTMSGEGSGSCSPGIHSPRPGQEREMNKRAKAQRGLCVFHHAADCQVGTPLGTVLCVSLPHEWLHSHGLLKVIHGKSDRLVAAPASPSAPSQEQQ